MGPSKYYPMAAKLAAQGAGEWRKRQQATEQEMVDLKQKSVAVQQAEAQIPNIDSQVKGTQVMSTQLSAVNKTLIDQQYDLKKLAMLAEKQEADRLEKDAAQSRTNTEIVNKATTVIDAHDGEFNYTKPNPTQTQNGKLSL